jgi:catalase-peroxidase
LELTAPEMVLLGGRVRALNANFGRSRHGIFTDWPGTLTNDFREPARTVAGSVGN